jgi:N-acetylglucosamine-6-sulfatase
VVVIQTDDQPVEQFRGTWVDQWDRERQIMPNTMRLIRNQGIAFNQYLTPFPVCAPSRASLLSGNYAHNHGVVRISGPRGGWDGYRSNAIHGENLAVWLQRAGYRTLHFGKFINHYGGADDPVETEVPPGWDHWVSDATDNSTREFYGYSQNVNGEATPRLGWPWYDTQTGKDPAGCPWLGLDVCHYHTDSMSLQAAEAIRNSDGRPFYLQVDYHTPHGDSRPPIGPEPAPRHYDTALRTPGPRPPSFNERDVSDKPWFLRENPKLTANEIQQLRIEHQKSVEALQSVDEGVREIYEALRVAGKLGNTYIFFTSDNGFFLGQHRIYRGKLLPYEPATRVPMVVRGPGIRTGSASREIVANHDIAPTVLQLARARPGRALDGRSMVPFWRRTGRTTRRPTLLSSYQAATRLIPGDYPEEPPPIVTGGGDGATVSASVGNQNHVGIRVGPYKYVRYEARGESELYLLTRDPYELRNRVRAPRYRKIVNYLDRQLDRLRGCRARTCRAPVPRWPKPPARP